MENRFLTETCEKCKGEGFLKTRFGLSFDQQEPCWVCKGTGKTPNQEGKDILELVNLFGRKR